MCMRYQAAAVGSRWMAVETINTIETDPTSHHGQTEAIGMKNNMTRATRKMFQNNFFYKIHQWY